MSSKHSTPRKAGKVDKATAAFQVQILITHTVTSTLQAIDSDNSGFVDREEFLRFTRSVPILACIFSTTYLFLFQQSSQREARETAAKPG